MPLAHAPRIVLAFSLLLAAVLPIAAATALATEESGRDVQARGEKALAEGDVEAAIDAFEELAERPDARTVLDEVETEVLFAPILLPNGAGAVVVAPKEVAAFTFEPDGTLAEAWTYSFGGRSLAGPPSLGTDDTIVLVADDGTAARLQAADGKPAAGGKPVACAGAKPATGAVAGAGCYAFGTATGGVAGFESETGKQAWTWTSLELLVPGSPDALRDRVTDPVSHTAPDAATAAIFFGHGDGHVYAADIRDGELLWKTRLSGPVRLAPLLLGSTTALVIGAADGADGVAEVVGLDTRSGERRWSVATGARVAGYCEIAPAGLVVAATSDGLVLAIDAGEGKVYWVSDVAAGRPSPLLLPPAVSGAPVGVGSFVAVPTGRGFALLDPKDGALLGRFEPAPEAKQAWVSGRLGFDPVVLALPHRGLVAVAARAIAAPDLAGTDAGAHAALARAYARAGDAKEAAEEIEEALAIRPDSPALLKEASDVHAAAGDPARSVARLLDYLDAGGDPAAVKAELAATLGIVSYARLPGSRYTAVRRAEAVAGGRLFTTIEDRIVALDAATLEEVWSLDAGAGSKSVLTRLGPLVVDRHDEGERVYAFSSDGAIICAAALDGKLIWRFKTEGDNAGLFAPTLAGDLVVACDGRKVYSLRKDSGELAFATAIGWALEAQPIVVPGAPAAVAVLPCKEANAYGVDLKTGKIVLKWKLRGKQWLAAPRAAGTVPNGFLLCLTGDADRSHLSALSLKTGRFEWNVDSTCGARDAGFVEDGTEAYLCSSSTTIAAIDPKTGKKLRILTAEGWKGVPILALENLIRVRPEAGDKDPGAGVRAHVVAWDLASGKEVFDVEVSDLAFAPPLDPVREGYARLAVPVIESETAYLVGADGTLHAVNLRRGELEWTLDVDAQPIWQTPFLDGDVLYVATAESLYGIDAKAVRRIFKQGKGWKGPGRP